jgi:hypothetical protein
MIGTRLAAIHVTKLNYYYIGVLIMKIVSKIKYMLLIASTGLLTTGSAHAFLINADANNNGYSSGVEKYLSAGTYEVVPVSGKFKAWTAWDLSNPKFTLCNDSNGCDRNGSDVKGWLNSFAFESPDLIDVTINGVAALPVSGDLYKVNQYVAYPDASSALTHAWSAEFTLTKAGFVSFMIPDSNDGGMSLHVVPEPSILALMALGLVGFGMTSRKKS